MSTTFPECLVSTSLLKKAIKGMSKIPRNYNKESPYRFLVVGTEESSWFALRAVDSFSYFECYATGEGVDIALEGQAGVEIKDFKKTIETAPMVTKIRVGSIMGGKGGSRLTIQSGSSSVTNLPLYDPTNILNMFPNILSEEELIAIRPHILMECLNRNTVLSLAQHKKDYENNGILIQKRADVLRFVTADNNRLVLTEGCWSGMNEKMAPENLEKLEKGILLPVSAIEHLLGILPAVGRQAMVSLAFSETKYCDGYTWIVFDDELVFRVNSLTPTRKFPEHSCFIDNKKEICLEFETDDLLNAVRRLKPLADNCLLALFDDQDSRKFIEVRGIRGASTFSCEELPYCSKTGDIGNAMNIGIRVGYLVDALSKISTKRVRVEVDGEKLPVRFTPVIGEKDQVYFSTYVYVTMPLDLQVVFRQD